MIETYDHKRWSPVSGFRILKTQFRAGFLVYFVIPFAMLSYELIFLVHPAPFEAMLIVVLILYIIYEIINLVTYKPLQLFSLPE
jgi:hypothetical protein